MENNERKQALASTLPPCNKQLHFPPLMAYFIILCISCVRIPTCNGPGHNWFNGQQACAYLHYIG